MKYYGKYPTVKSFGHYFNAGPIWFAFHCNPFQCCIRVCGYMIVGTCARPGESYVRICAKLLELGLRTMQERPVMPLLINWDYKSRPL